MENEEETRPMPPKLSSIDQHIIEAAERAIARERAKQRAEAGETSPTSEEHDAIAHSRAVMQSWEYRQTQASENSSPATQDEVAAEEEPLRPATVEHEEPKRAEAPVFVAEEEDEVLDQSDQEHYAAHAPAASHPFEPEEDPSVNHEEEPATVQEPIAADTETAAEATAGKHDPMRITNDIEADKYAAINSLHEGDDRNQHPSRKVAAPEMPEEEMEDEDAREIEPKERSPRVKVPSDPASVASAYLDAFFSELQRCGVTDFVISPGSRSTGLAMKAFERFKSVYVDVDERGAAFLALGIAKAKRRPVGVICTSGTAVGNWMPAVLEAESSRVPLLLLSSDRPPRLQGVGAPQTCDQLKMFGDHVKKFVQMPLPSGDDATLDFVHQTALDACIAAHGMVPGAASCDGGPVHINFPFDEPLVPARKVVPDRVSSLPPTVVPGQGLLSRDAKGIFGVFHGKHTVAVCGEGTCNNDEDVAIMLQFAHKRHIPLLADPLSGLRGVKDPYVIDNYDTVCGGTDIPRVDCLIRFGRWPVSKRLFQAMQEAQPTQIVVDVRDPRDYSASTDLFVHTLPVVFAQAMIDLPTAQGASRAHVEEWLTANAQASDHIDMVYRLPGGDQFEGAYIDKMFELIPDDSLLFCASSMSIRAVDTFYRKNGKRLRVLCNRGLNGIDGTISTAVGAAQEYDQTTLLIGDLAFLHDVNALSLQNEMHIRLSRGDGPMPSIVIVLLNNNGGAIFDMLSQKSTEDYFGRLFLTPQNIDVKHLAQGFGITYRRVETVHDFRRNYEQLLGNPGISIIDVSLPLAGVKDRYSVYWR